MTLGVHYNRLVLYVLAGLPLAERTAERCWVGVATGSVPLTITAHAMSSRKHRLVMAGLGLIKKRDSGWTGQVPTSS